MLCMYVCMVQHMCTYLIIYTYVNIFIYIHKYIYIYTCIPHDRSYLMSYSCQPASFVLHFFYQTRYPFPDLWTDESYLKYPEGFACVWDGLKLPVRFVPKWDIQPKSGFNGNVSILDNPLELGVSHVQINPFVTFRFLYSDVDCDSSCVQQAQQLHALQYYGEIQAGRLQFGTSSVGFRSIYPGWA